MRLFLPFLVALAVVAGGCSSGTVESDSCERLAGTINTLFIELRESTQALAVEASQLFDRMDTIDNGLYSPDRYAFYEDSVYYTPEDDGGCVVWASGLVPVDEALRLKITRMEHLCPNIQETSRSSKYISSSYVLGPEHFCVFYPFFDSVALMPPGVDVSTSILPYYLVDPVHNPEKRPRWVEPYIDATGLGYIITVSCPVYSRRGFEGVAGSDIAILPLSQDFFETRQEALFLVTEDTLLLAVNTACQELLSIRPLGEYYYLEGVQEDEYASESFQLTRHESPDIRALAHKLGSAGSFDMQVHGKAIRFHSYPIPEVGWTLVHAVAL